MKHDIRPATNRDYGEFLSMWEAFLKERELTGSVVPCSEDALRFATDIFFRIVLGRTPGVALIVPNKAVNLWGPELPFPTRYGRTLVAQGTFVRPDFRQHGLAMLLFDEGVLAAARLGFDAILSSVDTGNELSERNATLRGFENVQTTKIIPTAGREG